MAEFETEEQQVEALKAWFADNYRALVLGVLLGLGSIFGWRFYQGHLVDQSEAAAAIVFEMRESLEDKSVDALLALNEQLRNDYSGTEYSVMAGLLMAKKFAIENDYAKAESELSWVLKNTSNSATIALATLRLARVQLAGGDASKAAATTAIDEPVAFSGMYEELRGDIALSQGDRSKAREAYGRARSSGMQPLTNAQILDMKFNDVTPADSEADQAAGAEIGAKDNAEEGAS